MTTAIQWLHLTDLHAGQNTNAHIWPTVREHFYRDLERLYKRMEGPWDVVFFTGDLTFKGTEDEFRTLGGIFADLWEQFRKLGSTPVLLPVPGNHDLDRQQLTSPVVQALRSWPTQPATRDTFWTKEDTYLPSVRKAFLPFTNWFAQWRERNPHESYRSWRDGIVPGDFSATVVKDKLRLGVVGLNTAFLQLDAGDYEGQLEADLRQLNAVCGGDPVRWGDEHHAVVLLTHHPRGWLHASETFDRDVAPPNRFAVHLFGHMHESLAEYTRKGGSLPLRLVQGASLFSQETYGKRVKRVHGYAGGCLKAELSANPPTGELNIWPRILKSRRGGGQYVAPDWDNFELNQDDAVSEKLTLRGLEGRAVASKLLERCLRLPPSQIMDEVSRCRQIAIEQKIDEFQVARLRVELELFRPRSESAAARSEAMWSRVRDLARQHAEAGSATIELPTSFELNRAREGIDKYFKVLRKLGEPDRFFSRVKVREGFLAPIYLLTGLLEHFHDDWTPVLTAFGHSVAEGRPPEWRVPQSFIFDCWLLWGPSVPICSCARWRAPDGGFSGLALQYGYGDENNSLPVYVAPQFWDAVAEPLWSDRSHSDGTPRVPRPLARRASLVGRLAAATQFAGVLPAAQAAVATSRKYAFVIEYEGHEITDGGPGADYYSAYVWMMFKVKSEARPDAETAPPWLTLLPFFEHTNIAHRDTYDFMKDQLARKALSFIQRYKDSTIRFEYACAFDDSGHEGRLLMSSLSDLSLRDRVVNLLASDEFSTVRPHLDMNPSQPVLTACGLPEVVAAFYSHVSGFGAPPEDDDEEDDD